MPQDPAPPAQPAPPAGPGTAIAEFPGASIPLQGVPSSPQEIRGLRERREILRDQLQRATNRREELVGQLNETGNPDARTGLQQRLTLLDERLLQLERDQALTERLLSNAPPEVLALTRSQSDVTRVGMDEEEAFFLALFAFVAGVILTRIAGRIRRRRARKKQQVEATDDPRLERLSQAVDAIAEEVERIGEGQRFVTQLLAQKREPAALPQEKSSG